MTQRLIEMIELDAPGFPRDEQDRSELVNNFMSGHALAAHVLAELQKGGYTDGELIGEDWGWLLLAYDPGGRVDVEVRFSSVADDDDSGSDEFIVSVSPDTRTRRRRLIFREDVSAEAERLSRTIVQVLKAAEGVNISEIRYHDG